MVHRRLKLTQKLSRYSNELLALGMVTVRKYQASERDRVAVSAHTAVDADFDAALAALMPSPRRVSYRTVLVTLWQTIKCTLRPVTAWEPPAVKAWRRRVVAHLAGVVRQRPAP